MDPRVVLESSNVNYFEFDPQSQILILGFGFSQFEAERVYRYTGVPQSVVDGLHAAESKGRFVYENIAFTFPYEYLGEGD